MNDVDYLSRTFFGLCIDGHVPSAMLLSQGNTVDIRKNSIAIRSFGVTVKVISQFVLSEQGISLPQVKKRFDRLSPSETKEVYDRLREWAEELSILENL